VTRQVVLSGSEVLEAIPPAGAVDAIIESLRSGARPDRDHPRNVLDLTNGQLLLMPSEHDRSVGVKVLGISQDNHKRGEPRIQGVFVLMDSTTFEPLALLDGAALTVVRTPAVSFAGIRDLIRSRGVPLRVAIVGVGPQAVAHQDAASDLFRENVGIRSSTFISRSAPGQRVRSLSIGTREARDAIADANLVICATSSATPVIGAHDLGGDAIVVAIGSHERDKREVAGEAFHGAAVIVEDRDTAMREAGDVILATQEGHVDPESLIDLRSVANGLVDLPLTGRVIVKTTGMSWEDVVIARAIVDAKRGD
jgi:ornithine cyclodeaminase/alanine dehydrogenase-like protein (mu-crystallin family)